MLNWRNIVTNVAYVGNDIDDLEAIRNVGYPIVPADVHITYRDKKIAKIITNTMGGDGIIREITDFIV